MRDFFRPVEGSNFCEMLTSYNKHQWSADGETWVDVDFYSHTNRNGGSADGWPRDKGRAGDERRFLSFWGPDDSRTGGCCSSSTAVAETYPALPGNGGGHKAWGQPFSVSFLYVHLSYEEAMQLANQVQLLNRAVGNLTDDLAVSQANAAGLTNDLAAEKAQVAAVTDNLTTCSIDLEQQRRTTTSRTTPNFDAIQDTPNDLQEQQDEFKEQFDAAGADVADGGCGNDASVRGLSVFCVRKILQEKVDSLTAQLSTAQNASSTRDNDGNGAEDDVHDPECQCRSKQTLVTVLLIVGVLLLVAGIAGFVFLKRKVGSSAPTKQNRRARNRPPQQRRQGRQGGGRPAAPSAALPANNVQREPYGAGGMPAVYGNDSYEPVIINVAAGDGDSGNANAVLLSDDGPPSRHTSDV